MNLFFIIFIPVLLFIINEYYQNKIFFYFEKFYKYSKIIALFIPLLLLILILILLKNYLYILKILIKNLFTKI